MYPTRVRKDVKEEDTPGKASSACMLYLMRFNRKFIPQYMNLCTHANAYMIVRDIYVYM